MIAQLNESNVCVGVTTDINVIGISVDTFDVLGKKYENGEWLTIDVEPTQLDRIESSLTDADTVQAELLFNQANADLDTQLILETLAEILLNQQGV